MRFVSYNLRFASENDPQPWSRRRGPMIDLVSALAPDVLGAQEGLDHQLAELMDGLDARYRLVSEHRGDGETEENSALIFNSNSVELLDVDHRWLSDTPKVPGSISWGATLPRMYSVGAFRRLADGREFSVIVTHFDHQSAEAQARSADQLVRVITGFDPQRPVVLMGDFNAGEDSEPYAVLTGAGLQDAYLVAAERGRRLGTFNDYGPPDPDGVRIDWILVNDRVAVESARMVDHSPFGQYPSDHLPVEAVLTF